MSDDPRFKPLKEQDGFAIIPDRWKIDYFASAGELTSGLCDPGAFFAGRTVPRRSDDSVVFMDLFEWAEAGRVPRSR